MKVADFILCDDIRRELANKLTIVGAYNDRIEFITHPDKEGVEFPLNIRCSAYVRLLNEEKKNFDEITILFYSMGEEVYNLSAKIEDGSDIERPIVLPFPIPSLKVNGIGPLEVKILIKSGENIVEELKPDIDFQFTEKSRSLN